MQYTLTTKTLNFVSNVQSGITWDGFDFARLGFESRIYKPISVRFIVSQTGSQAAYLSISYITNVGVITAADRSTIAALVPNKQIEIGASSAPALARLNPDIISITLNIISGSSGTLTASIIIDDEVTNPQSFSPFGTDERVLRDFLFIQKSAEVSGTDLLNPGTTQVFAYQCPFSKRATIHSLELAVFPCPSQIITGNEVRLRVIVRQVATVPDLPLVEIRSEANEIVYAFQTADFFSFFSSDTQMMEMVCYGINNTTVQKRIIANCFIKEYF